jgi:predicted CXXCH cytochrome family protein
MRSFLFSFPIILVLGVLFGCGAADQDLTSDSPVTSEPTWVGSTSCRSCHAEAYAAWQQSHHAQAMLPATDSTMLADFASIEAHSGAQFSEAGQSFKVTLADKTYPVTHTFGVAPLQQYLADVGEGRLQTLRESWDSRPREKGGQRWFLQYPEETIPPGDVLHWLGQAQNWNSSCADCHTTGFQKGYDRELKQFDSTYAEMAVGCEACHGPGSTHAANPTVSLPAALTLQNPKTQPDVCAPCHARRQQIAEGYTAGSSLLDHYVPQLLNEPIYHADGQINDEVYVYGSFVSSKMFQRGVTCNDCHAPHSGELKIAGDGLCLQCHSPSGNPRFPTLTTKTYASPGHHQHPQQSVGARCVSCHMPTKTYMGVDVRHDHSLRIPQPNLAKKHGAPNVCAQCHEDKSTTEDAPTDHFSRIFVLNSLAAESSLRTLANDKEQNAIVRATALSRLSNSTQAGSVRTYDAASRDPDDLVRYAAVAGLASLEPRRRSGAFGRLLSDPLRAIRTHAASVAINQLNAQEQSTLQPQLGLALEEYVDSNLLNAETPGANVNLASVALTRGQFSQAHTHLTDALSINPQFLPALLNMADLLRAQNKDCDAQPFLLTALNLNLDMAEVEYAYAMWLVRNGSQPLALTHLQRAHQHEPETPQWAYAYAIAMHSLGQTDGALALLRSLSAAPIYNEQLMFLHATIARDQSTIDPQVAEEALEIATKLVERAPSNPNYQGLYEALSR